MAQLIRGGGKQTASKGQGSVEFELNLERSPDVQKVGGQIIQLNSNSMHFVTVLIAYYTASSPRQIENG